MVGVSRAGSRHHVAVVEGPDGGWVAPLPEDRAVVVGRAPDADLPLADPDLSRHHLALRDRRGRLQARALTGRVVRLRRARRRRSGRVVHARGRRLRRRWRPVPVGSRLVAGGTVLEVRPHPGLAPPAEATPSPDLGEGLGLRLLVPLAMAASMVPLALTSAASSPWRAVTWVVLPLALVAAVVWPWWRQRAARRRSHPEPPPPAPPPDPAGLLAAADHPWRREVDLLDAGWAGHGRRARHRTVAVPDPGHAVAVVGPSEAARAMVRWLLCQLVHAHPPEDLAVVVPPGWDWAAPLPHTATSASASRVVVVEAAAGGAPALPRDAVALVVAPSLAQVPPGCAEVVEVGERHDRTVGTAWAHEIALALARASTGAAGLPAVVPLTELVGTPTPREVIARWRDRPAGLVVPVGAGEQGPVWLDLAAAGPHALVAGTTGSGKSELLTTWVLGLALAHAPADLHVLLVDYKGGATFGALAALPHVVGVLTDLDSGSTARALAGLRAEVARRERVLADAGCRSLAELHDRGRSLPRLLVVVDEFRTLADTHPELLDGLVRLAAQGRSLGIHLVLATQRPGGAVTADMRANIAVRVCLRVLEQTDSVDVLGDAAAASLPAVPGRAVLRTDAAVTVQVAWPGAVDDGLARLVGAVTAACATAAGADASLVRVVPPWAPPLPDVVPTSALPEPAVTGVPLLLLDEPDHQRHAGWHLATGDSLLVTGPPGSGRSTAAQTLAREAVARGVVTHAVAGEPVVPPAAPARGTVCGPDDVARLHRLLQELRGPRPQPELLVVDDVDAAARALDEVLGFGRGTEMVQDLLREARRHRLGVALTAATPATRWAAQVRHHLVLAPRDVTDALVAGVPRELVDLGSPPGRGVLLDGRSARTAHVATSDATGPWPTPATAPLRLEPLPTLVDLPPGTGVVPGSTWLLVGLGGAAYGPVGAPLPDGAAWLVLGGPRSGRTTALRMLAARLRASGRTVWTDPAEVPSTGAGVLVLDDVDRLAATAAAAAASCAERGVTLLATARPGPLAAAYHDLARRLRDPDVLLVLGEDGAPPWTGPELRPLVAGPRRAGRGVLVTAGRAEPVQVDRCRAAQRTVPVPEEEDDEGRFVAATDAGSSSPAATASEAARAG